jgi:hypothetical protein
MRTQKPWVMTALCTFALLANSLGVLAQGRPQEKERANREERVKREQEVSFPVIELANQGGIVLSQSGVLAEPGMVLTQSGGDYTFSFTSAEFSFDGKVVKSAPYSAEAVTETIQTLSDGNRIVRRTTAMVYRDSEGRTRREQALTAVGPWMAVGDPPKTIFINDPVAGVNYILDPSDRTARKMDLKLGERAEAMKRELEVMSQKMAAEMSAARVSGGSGTMTRRTPAPPLVVTEDRTSSSRLEAAPRAAAASGGSFGVAHFGDKAKMADKAKTESLGRQIIEGVEAEGTRTTFTIPAGEIGNERPIEIISERWYSPELQVVILTKHNDPRTGENIYRLVNLIRSEPARSLFELPADYTIKDNSFIRMLPARKKSGEDQ